MLICIYVEVSNPKLVVILGCFGLSSNIVGLFLFHGMSFSVYGLSQSASFSSLLCGLIRSEFASSGLGKFIRLITG